MTKALVPRQLTQLTRLAGFKRERPQIRAPQEPLLRRSTRHKSPPSDDASQEPKDKKDEKSAKERLGVGSKKDDKDKAKELGLSNVPEVALTACRPLTSLLQRN